MFYTILSIITKNKLVNLVIYEVWKCVIPRVSQCICKQNTTWATVHSCGYELFRHNTADTYTPQTQRDCLRLTVHTAVSPWHSWVDQIDNFSGECARVSALFIPGIPVPSTSKPHSCTLSKQRDPAVLNFVVFFVCRQFNLCDLCDVHRRRLC